MSFYDFMQGFIDDKIPLGEPASWINQDQDFPKHEYLTENIPDYFSKMPMSDYECLEVIKRSLSLYEGRQI